LSPLKRQHGDRLVHLSAPVVDRQRVAAGKRLSTKLHVNEVLAASREVVLLLQVGEEGLDVAVPGRDRSLGRDEAVGVLAAAAAAPELPGLASDRGGLEDGADGGDGAVFAEPVRC